MSAPQGSPNRNSLIPLGFLLVIVGLVIDSTSAAVMIVAAAGVAIVYLNTQFILETTHQRKS